ncbi:MAG: YraN family protein [Oscillospiraceae bacterium]
MNTKLIGAAGESLAAKYYRDNGYELIAANYRTRMGEIDIIAKQNDMIIFVEVKSRSIGSIAAPREFVTQAKQDKIILAAKNFLVTHDFADNYSRFDVIEVYIGDCGEHKINCIENAFTLK